MRVKEYRAWLERCTVKLAQSHRPQGVASYIPYKGSVQNILKDLEGGIQSGLSYTGARNLVELRRKVEWARQTSAGTTESGTHIFTQNGTEK